MIQMRFSLAAEAQKILHRTLPIGLAPARAVALVAADGIGFSGSAAGAAPARAASAMRQAAAARLQPLRPRGHLNRRSANGQHQLEICSYSTGGGRIFSTFGSVHVLAS